MTCIRSPLRLVRAALFAAVCVVLAAAGHTMMSGRYLPLSALSAAFALTGAGAWLAAGRRRGPVSIGAGLLAVQGALHLIFAESESSRARPLHTAGSPGPATHHGAPGAMPMHGHGTSAVQDAVHGDAGMLAAHVLAGLCCALWLWRGEIAFFRLLRCVHAVAFTPLRLLLSVPGPVPDLVRTAPPRTRAGRCAPLRSTLLSHVLSRRGPPDRPVPDVTAPARLRGHPA